VFKTEFSMEFKSEKGGRGFFRGRSEQLSRKARKPSGISGWSLSRQDNKRCLKQVLRDRDSAQSESRPLFGYVSAVH